MTAKCCYSANALRVGQRRRLAQASASKTGTIDPFKKFGCERTMAHVGPIADFPALKSSLRKMILY
jgi:hypothetical protein